jgi:protein-disulfide isomerase
MKRHQIVLFAAVCLLACALAVTAEPSKPAPAAGPVAPEAMSGLVFDGLTPEQKALAVKILNENSCDCGCGMKVAVCRRDDPKCPRSPGLGTSVIDLVKQGKGRDEIVKAVLTPPTKFVSFALTPGDSPAIGPKNAKVTLLHYFDYQCPFCTRVGPAIEQIAKDYPDSVRIVYKMHPLSMHPNALPAAEAAMAAAAQGKFIEMHRKLFENQQQLTREKFLGLAKEIGLDVDRFTKDIDAHKYLAAIQKDSKEAEDIGATGTPASFINGRYLSGAKPYGNFKDIIDEELGWAKAGNRPEFKTAKNVSEATPKTKSSGPDPNKVYDLAAGNAPSRGPAAAKVTILHYYDYQ